MNLHTMSVMNSVSFDLYPLLVEQDMRDRGHAHWHTGMPGVSLEGRIYLDLMPHINKTGFLLEARVSPTYGQNTDCVDTQRIMFSQSHFGKKGQCNV